MKNFLPCKPAFLMGMWEKNCKKLATNIKNRKVGKRNKHMLLNLMLPQLAECQDSVCQHDQCYRFISGYCAGEWYKSADT